MLSTLKSKFNLQRFFVGEGPQQPPYYLSHRRVYILPTKQGLGFGLLLFIMLLGSINYENSLGYFLTFLLASLSIVAIFHTYNNLLHLSIGPAICKPVFANNMASFKVKIDNLQYQARFSIIAFTSYNSIVLSDLNEKSLNTLQIKHKFNRRGLINLPRFTLETRFPFGLFRAWTIVELDQKQLVYPKPSSDKNLPDKSAGISDGMKQNNKGTDDFKGLRTYIEGDPLQHIHWKTFARHHTLQTKEFSSPTTNEMWLNWSETTVKGTEQKLSQLTRWVLLAESENISFGLRLPNITIQPNTGKQHLDSCLKQLALYGLTDLVN